MRISIRYQILGLMVGVVAVALAAFLALAVRLFTRDQLAYIYDLEASLTTTLAEEVRASLVSRVDKIGYFAVQQSAAGPEAAARTLLSTDPDLLSIEIWQPRGGGYARTLRYSDPVRLGKLNVSETDLAEARRITPVPFEAVAAEGALLQNASLPPDVAILSLAAAPPGTDLVVVALFQPDQLLRIFGRSPSYRAYLVDGKGLVVVDPDPAKVVSRQSAEAVPVVREATRGTVTRGVHEFEGAQGPIIGAFSRVGLGRLAVIAEIPRAEALRATHQLARRSVLFAAAILFLAVIASVALGRRLTAPLRRLEEATRVVAQGDLATPVQVSTRNEIGSLAESFNRMAKAITDREARLSEAHNELIQAERLSVLGEISASVVHEVKNPLTTIVGYAQLGSTVQSSEQAREYFQLIESSAWRARDILRTLLEFARQEKVDLVPIDVNGVIHDTMRMLKHQLQMARVEAGVELAEGLPLVQGNSGQLQQVLVNLIVNAAEAMEGSPRRQLSMRSALEGETVVLSVADTGSGIPPDAMAKLFTPFFTTKPRGKGTGLGLSVSQRIVNRFGGEIRVESRPGEGSTFMVRLPASAAAARPAPQLAEEAPAAEIREAPQPGAPAP
jgi:signal transduction histidine kinase